MFRTDLSPRRVCDAQDRYANREVALLLQRIASYDGVVMLASNRSANIDKAFVRDLGRD